MNNPQPDEIPSTPKFQNKAERNKDVVTVAMAAFDGKSILLERPENMEFDVYKYIQKMQSEIIKKLFPKAPDKRLQQAMRPHTPLMGARRGFVKVQTQRKAS
jgi:hypothetical protein